MEIGLRSGMQIEFWWPARAGEAFGPGFLENGQCFTIRDSGELWRCQLERHQVDDDGAGVTVEMKVIGRYEE